jgi:amino acid transporter
VLVGSTIGSGIFRTPAVIAGRVPDVGLFMLAWLLGGVVAVAGALCFAELAAMFPRTGGVYVYLRETYGRTVAFVFGWTELVILRPAAFGAIALTSAAYGWRVSAVDGDAVVAAGLSRTQLTAMVMIAGLAWVHARRAAAGAWLQDVSTVLKVVALGALACAGLTLAPAVATMPAEVASGGTTATGFALAMVAILWAYDGWGDVGFIAGEVRDPQRALPRAFVAGTALVVALYLLANLAYLSVVPIAAMPASPLVAADVAQALFGPAGAIGVAALVALSTFGTLNGAMMTGPRIFFAMAEDGLLPRAVGGIHPRHGTPAAAIALAAALGVAFVAARDFASLADQFVIGIWPFYALAVVAVIVWRARAPELPRAYRTWGYPRGGVPWLPLLFVAAAVFLLGSYAVADPVTFGANLALMLAGVPLGWWLDRGRRGRRAA